MSTFEIKTHKLGRTYNTSHFFILSKGLNSGKPLNKPCPNCFVITTQTQEENQTLFYLCLSLKIGRYFEYYLKGSVIPFITINDCFNVLKKAYSDNKTNSEELQKHITVINQIQKREENLKQCLEQVKQLKVAFIQSYFSKQRKIM